MIILVGQPAAAVCLDEGLARAADIGGELQFRQPGVDGVQALLPANGLQDIGHIAIGELDHGDEGIHFVKNAAVGDRDGTGMAGGDGALEAFERREDVEGVPGLTGSYQIAQHGLHFAKLRPDESDIGMFRVSLSETSFPAEAAASRALPAS